MFTTFIGLIDIQSWWEVPCIAHFCSLFSTTFQLPKFDIEDLEEALLTDADAEGEVDLKVYTARLLPELIVALLKGCDALAQIGAHISPSNYQMFLRRLFRQKCQEYNVDNPFNTDTDFEKLPLRTKILILKYLCDFRLDSEDVSITFANYEADSLRLEPIGYDRKGSSYWHFFGTRLYREDFVSSGKSKSAKSSVWQVICFTEEDWRNLANKLDNSSNTKERNLHDLLVENFLPYIPKLFRDKERERRNRLLERPRLTRLKLLQEGKTLQLQEQFQKQQKEEEIDRERQTLSEVVQQKTLPLVPERAQLLSEARAKRAERRSRSNSVTSIVSPYDSSPDEASLLTRDFIFQPKENAFRSKANSSYLYRSTTNLRGSTSPSVGSLLEQQELLDHYDGSDVPRGTNSIRSVSSASSARSSSVDSRDQSNLGCNSSCGRSEDSESQYDSKPTIYHDSYYIVSRREDSESVHSFSDIEAENNINSGNTDTNNKQQLVESSETSSIIKPLCQQQTKTERKDRPVRVVSAEVEKLLRSNHNMAPTATKLPGRQTNNSLSSVTGPVILPFSDAAAKGTASNSGKGNDTAPGTNQGRKKKGKSANVITAATYTNTSFTKTSCSASSIFVSSSLSFTETDEVLQIGMHKVLESIKNHDDAWPFMDPVDEDIAPKYYSIIRRPMDLQKMEEKLDNGEYMMFSDFQNDFKLIVNNCRLYNGQANEYTEMVNNLQIAFERARKKYFDENSSDEELMSHEYPDVSRANAAFKEKVSSKESSKANSSDAVNGKSERQHSKPAKEAIYPKGGDYTKEKSKKSASSGGNGNNSLSAKSNNTSSNANSKDSVEASCRGNDKPCKESKTKSVKSGTAVADKKGGKNVSGEKKHPATVGAVSKKHKTNKQPEVDSEPEPDPEPPEKDKSASRVNKTVKRKRKEKEKTDKAKSKKQKTEESDYSDMDVPENEENVDVKSEEDRECSEPERKRYKRDQVMEHAEPSKKLLGETDTITKGDSKMVEDVKEEEDFPVYESKKKAAIKALQEKEKKKNSAKVKKEEKKINKSPKGAKGKDVKSETFSPIRGRSISRSPSPSQDVSSPIKQSPDRSLSPKKRESARDLSSDTGDHNSVPGKTGSKKGKEKNGTESSVAHQKPHKKGSTIKTGSGIAVAKLDKKTKKSGTLSSGKGGKGRQKKAGSGKQKTVTDLEEEFDFEEMPHDRRDSVQIHTNGDRIDVTDVSDFENIEDIRMKSHDNSVDESATNKSSEKTKSKKNKTNKKNVGKSSAHEHHRAKKNGSKSKGKDKKLDKKSHKRDKIGKGKKKSKASNHDRTIGEDRETMSSIGEDDDGIDYDQKMEEFGDVEKSASKPVKQSKNSRYHSAQRSVSRSPSPARSYYSDDRSIRDSEEEDDDAQNERGSSSNKQTDESLSANRSITPDIKDKFDLIKERRNRAAAAAAAAAEAKALTKQAKAKGKDVTATAGTGKKGKSSKSSSNRGHKQQRDIVEECTVPSTSASSSGSKQQHKKQQQQQHGEEDEKASGENKSVKAAAGTLTKGKKNRDKATSNSSESATVWAKPSDKKHTRPSSSSLSADSAKTVDRSNEYDFVDDSVAADSKADKNHPKSSNTAGNTSKTGKKSTVAVGSTAQTGTTSQKHPKSNAKAMPPSSGKHSKTTATSVASGAGAAGANMEELELETEQTLKDINKWLENTPRFPEYSSASNSPSRYIMDDFDTVPVKIEPADFRKPIPLSQLPAANDAPGGPLQGASPGLATMAAPPKAFSPRAAASAKDPQSTSSTSGKQPNTKLPSQPKDGVNKSEIGTVGTDTITVATALKDSTNSSNGGSSGAGSSTAGGKAAGSTSHTILGPPPIIPPHSQKKEPKEPKRKSLKEKLSLGLGVGGRKRDLHHHRTTIDRLQPGKTKGNLIGTIQNLNKPDELFLLGSSGGPGGNNGAGNNPLNKVKEVKNSLIVKTDESKPKLSLGTVLNTEGFGIVQQHNFADDENDSDRRSLGSKDDGGDEDDPIATIGSGTAKPLLSSLKATALVNVGGGSPISTREGGSVSKKDEPSSSATVTGEKPEASSDHVAVETKSTTSSVVEKLFSQEDGKSGKEEANGKDPQCNKSKDKPSATPNLNAWIKAFGAPKKPKKSDDTEEPSKGSPVSDKGKINETTSTQSSSNESSSGIGSLPAVPGSLESPSYPTLPTVPRQRKASTGSTVSERSSYSQDPDSPRIGIDERLGAYPAPYPSPIGASPIMTSPKLDETQKSPYHPLNGAIKVGFYQDTTQKSSPEKSCSPRDLPSPYPQYSQHLYTSNAANTSGGTAGTNNNIGGNNAVYGNYSSYGTTTSAIGSTGSSVNQNNPSSGGVTDSFKGYGKELKSPVDFYDQYKQPASQESDYNSSMSPSTNPNSPYHNPASSPYQQQPNSPSCYQQQTAASSSPYGHQPPSLASPASSGGPLSPYNATAVPHSPATSQTTAASVSGHSPYNPNQGQSPYHSNQGPSASTSPSAGTTVGSTGQPKLQSKPNTPLHQSPNSPFSQSNQSSPYSQQDPNSPYSSQGGQLSPFQPMSPKPPASSAASSGNSNSNNAIKLAPPIITPQQAAAAAGVILPPESPVHSQTQSTPPTAVSQAQNLTGGNGTGNGGNNPPSSTPGTTIPSAPMQLNSHQSPWTAHHNQYNPYLNHPGDTAGGAASMASSLPPAPAHMPPSQQGHLSNVHTHPSPAHTQHQQHQQHQQQHPLQHQQQHQQDHQQQHQQNHQQAHGHHLATAQQQQQSHLGNLLMGSNNNPYTSTYGRPYDLNSVSASTTSAAAGSGTTTASNIDHHHAQHHPQHLQHQQQQHTAPHHQQQQQQHPSLSGISNKNSPSTASITNSSKVPEMINLGYSEPETNSTKPSQDVPMNMESSGGMVGGIGKEKSDGAKDNKHLQQQHQQQHQAFDHHMGGMGYGNPMDISISKSKAFDMFNRTGTMAFPRGFGAPGVHQPTSVGNTSSTTNNASGGYDHRAMQQVPNMNKAHDMSGGGTASSGSSATSGYNMQQQQQQSAVGKSTAGNQHPTADQPHLPRYDQRSPQHLQQHHQQQQHGGPSVAGSASQASNTADLSSTGGGYKPYGASTTSATSASLMDPAIRNLSSLSSLYNPDDRLLVGGPGAGGTNTSSAGAGFYDKGMPPAAHMFSKNLSQPPPVSSSAATTSSAAALQQMFNNTMAATTMAAYNANREQPNAASYVPSPNYHHPQQHHQRSDMMSAGNIQSQKVSHNANVPPTTGSGASVTEPTPAPAKPKRTRKKKDQNQDLMAQHQQQQQQSLHQHAMHAAHQQQTLGAHQGFPPYPGLKPPNPSSSAGGGSTGMGSSAAAPGAVGNPSSSGAETSAISLKTANIVPGSAFNFGPGPTGLGLPPGSLYGDTSASTYLEDSYRNPQNPYYLPPSHRATTAAGSGGTGTETDKLGNPIGAQPAAPGSVAAAAAVAAASAAAVHGPPPPTAASPYHQFLASHHGTRPYQFMNQFDPLHQQYLRQEELRAQMMINQGLLGAPPGTAPSVAYGQPGYHHPAIGMHKPYDAMNSMNRSPFL